MATSKSFPRLIEAVDDYLTENIVEHLPCMVYRCLNNADWQMLYISRGAYDLTGYSPETLMSQAGPALPSLIVAEDKKQVWCSVQAAIKNGLPFEISHRINTSDGKQKWILNKGRARYTAEYHKNPETTLPKLTLEGIIVDITEQKLAELKLRESKKLQYRMLDGSIEGILIHRDWKALYLNKSLLNMLGYNAYREVLTLDSLSPLIAEHDRERLRSYTNARANFEPAPSEYEFDALHKDGSIRCMEIKSTRIDWMGKPAIFSTVIDITKRKNALLKAEEQRQKLAHSNRINMLGEVTAGIAHELNQPLSAIASRCAAAKNRINHDTPDLDKIKRALDSIEEEAIRSGEIIKQLRSLVKRQENQFETIDLNALLETCLKFIKMEGLFNNSCICTNITKHLPAVIADPIQIQQVLLNLIHNANDAMQDLPSQERCLTITAIQHDDSAVQISVSDNGHGITSQQEDELFQSFYTTKDDGMGMGLSISRTIITAHKGFLWFSRNAEQGVTFRFTLPVYID